MNDDGQNNPFSDDPLAPEEKVRKRPAGRELFDDEGPPPKNILRKMLILLLVVGILFLLCMGFCMGLHSTFEQAFKPFRLIP